MQSEAKDRGNQCARERHADDSPSACPTALAATRTCAATGPRQRSTPQGACFMTSPDVTRTSVACEVKLYLAVPSPSSSRLALPGLVASSSLVPRRARSGSGTATPDSRSVSTSGRDQNPLLDRLAGRLAVIGLVCCQRWLYEARQARVPTTRGGRSTPA